MVRAHNEDAIFADSDAGLAVLADGMGGYSAGEVASGIAVNIISNGLLNELRSGRELSKGHHERAHPCCAPVAAADCSRQQGHLRRRVATTRMRRHGNDA